MIRKDYPVKPKEMLWRNCNKCDRAFLVFAMTRYYYIEKTKEGERRHRKSQCSIIYPQ